MESVKLLQSWMFLIWAFAEKIPYFLRTNLKMLLLKTVQIYDTDLVCAGQADQK